MKEKEGNNLSHDVDRHLDTPSESNRDKHINFLEAEDTDSRNNESSRKDKATEERQKEWREGIEEGKKMRDSE